MLRSVNLIGPAGRLETLLNEGAPDAPFAAVLCPPHPLLGGTMHNKVLYHAMKALNDPEHGLGWPVLRINFRGSGLSQGVHDGLAESGDVLAALEWMAGEYELPLVACGFSFGAAMSAAACCTPSRVQANVRGLVALGLPIRVDAETAAPAWMSREYRYPYFASCTLPKLFLSGDCDSCAPADELAQLVANSAAPKRLILIPGADHFFSGQLEPMQQALTGWLKEHLL